MKRIAALATGLLCALPAAADEVVDTLNSAISAYEGGDVQYALEELAYAQQLLLSLKTNSLQAFLPEAPEGWTRTINEEMNTGLAMMGGGVGAEATYNTGTDDFTLRLMMDNPMVAALAGMIPNAAVMGAKIERVGREKFMNQNGELTALIGNRVLVQASGGELSTMLDFLKTMDFGALADFGR